MEGVKCQKCNSLLLVVLLVYSFSAFTVVKSDPAKATDVFKSPCTHIEDQHFVNLQYQGYSLWSSPSTWPNGKVPVAGAKVVIPCGISVLLDVANVSVGLLQVKGLLRVKDDPKLPSIYVKANYILVEGQLYIGTPNRHFRQKVTFELTPNLKGRRAELAFTSFAPADPKNPRKLGHKAFAVVGGQVRFYGMPGGSTTPSWSKLAKTALDGQRSITLSNSKASTWPVGAEIAIASTDFDWKQAERFIIAGKKVSGSNSILTLSGPLQYMHYGNKFGLPDGFGGYINECAEVALLTRNIVIRGTQEAAPYDLEGGHFMIFMTPTPQKIEGVEFVNMGQQGTLGRYPLHFHILGKAPKNSCRKNSIHDSMQRCIILHATDDMMIEDNVAFNTFGHCIITEEGGETGNTFHHNLAFATKEVIVKISDDETDDRPSSFWISNSQNNYIANAAGGGDSSGFWIEHRFAVRGASMNIPRISDIIPFKQVLRRFSGNVAHSYKTAGIRTYPAGWRPRNADNARVPAGTIDNMLVYKIQRTGAFLHITEQLTFKDSTFADNGVGIFMSRVIGNVITNCRIIGQTLNYGNPSGCTTGSLASTSCKPITGCSMPLASDSLGRSTGNMYLDDPIFGIQISGYEVVDPYPLPIRIENSKFSKFYSRCAQQSAIMTFGEGNYWLPPQLTNLQFDSKTLPIWTPPKTFRYLPLGKESVGGELSQFMSVKLNDKTVSSAGPGFLVANYNAAVLPPSVVKKCTLNTAMNAYTCPKLCYRSVGIVYDEPGWTGNGNVYNLKHGDVSYLQVTRSDGKVIILDGNLNDKKSAELFPDQRFFSMTLLSTMTFQVVIIPGTKKPSFYPAEISVNYVDVSGCGDGITIQIKPKANKQLTIETSELLSYKTCHGSETPSPLRSEFSYACISGIAWAELTMGGDFTDTAVLTSSSKSTACSTNMLCTLVWSGIPKWSYQASGKAIVPEFTNPLTSNAGWKSGTPPMGYDEYNSPILRTILPSPSSKLVAYYFRRFFQVQNSLCYSSLVVDILVKDGVVVYLNNNEILRQNMPAGKVTNSTLANPEESEPLNTWYKISVPMSSDNGLVEGKNFLAVETHVLRLNANRVAFDIGITGKRKSTCFGASTSVEVCDGIDNDNDGLIDKLPNGKPLTQACKTACGSGIATCISGVYQKCTAKQPKAEICNGIDDNCDGLIDNGLHNLNCGDGVCYQGTCMAATNATKSVQIWPRNSNGWSYYDAGGNLDAKDKYWKTGTGSTKWATGKAPLGIDNDKQSWNKFGTIMNRFTADRISRTGYFVKLFTLTKKELKDTFSIDFSVRRIDGAVVYLNGVEVHRSNMPWGKIKYDTPATQYAKVKESSPGCCNLQWQYNACNNCFHNTSAPLKVGVNKIAVELHTTGISQKTFLFDMDLYRKAYFSCGVLPGSPSKCVRKVKDTIIAEESTWSYADASLPVPAVTWMLPKYSDKTWKTGIAPFGFGKSKVLTNTQLKFGKNAANPLTTYYFRKSVTVSDAGCYVQLNSSLVSRDGAIVYINGVEMYRQNMPDGPANATSSATFFGQSDYVDTSLSGGWLLAGRNVIAVELHRYRNNVAAVLFDLQISGYREGATCLISPGPNAQALVI